MIIEEQAKIIGEITEVATKVEIYCPNCGRDVDETELSAKKCNDCGTDLSTPEQHVAVAVTSVPAFAITF
jgi:predicted RNA-binding Zn-ribbon protein involved in translation (DUF1610 family)